MSEPMHTLLAILVIVALGAVLLAWVAAGDRREHNDIENWASDNGYHLLKLKKRPVLLTPFRSDLQIHNSLVYYVEVLTQEHRIRRAYIRIRGQLLHFDDDMVEVRWAK